MPRGPIIGAGGRADEKAFRAGHDFGFFDGDIAVDRDNFSDFVAVAFVDGGDEAVGDALDFMFADDAALQRFGFGGLHCESFEVWIVIAAQALREADERAGGADALDDGVEF